MADQFYDHFATVAAKGLGAYANDPSAQESYSEIAISSGSIDQSDKAQPSPQKVNDNGNRYLSFNGDTAEATTTTTDIDKYRWWMDTAGNANSKDGTLLVAEWNSGVTGLENGQDYTVNEATIDSTNGFAEQVDVGTNNAADYDFELTHDGGTETQSRTGVSDMTTNAPGDGTLEVEWGGTDIEFENTSGSQWTAADNLQVKINGLSMATGGLSQSYDVPDGATLIIQSIKITYDPNA